MLPPPVAFELQRYGLPAPHPFHAAFCNRRKVVHTPLCLPPTTAENARAVVPFVPGCLQLPPAPPHNQLCPKSADRPCWPGPHPWRRSKRTRNPRLELAALKPGHRGSVVTFALNTCSFFPYKDTMKQHASCVNFIYICLSKCVQMCSHLRLLHCSCSTPHPNGCVA